MPKGKKAKSSFDTQQETRVLLEQIRLEVRTVSEQHGSIMEKLQEHDQRFNKIEAHLEKIDLKLLSHDGKFADMEARFDRLEGKIDRIEKVITGVMSEHETRIKKVEEKTALI